MNIMSLLSDPRLAMAAGLLNPNGTYGSFGASLQNGLANMQQSTLNNLTIQKAQRDAENRKKQQELIDRMTTPSFTHRDLQNNTRAILAAGGTPPGPLGPMTPLERNPYKAAMSLLPYSDNPLGSLATLLNYSKDTSNKTAIERYIESLPPSERQAAYDKWFTKQTYIAPQGADGGSEFERAMNAAGFTDEEKSKYYRDRAISLSGNVTPAVQKRLELAEERLRIANENLTMRGQSIDISRSNLEERLRNNRFSNASTLRSDYSGSVKGLKDQLGILKQMDVALSGDVSALDDKAITNMLSSFINSNQRAQAELNSYNNFGSLSERLSGAVTRFLTGNRTEGQRQQIKDLMNQIRYQVLEPAKNEIDKAYFNTSQRNNIDWRDVIMGDTNVGGGNYSTMTLDQLQAVDVDSLSGSALDDYISALEAKRNGR